MERRKINTTLVLTIDIILLILSIFVYNYIFDVEALKYSTKTVDKVINVEYNNDEVRLCNLYILF